MTAGEAPVATTEVETVSTNRITASDTDSMDKTTNEVAKESVKRTVGALMTGVA